MEYFNSLTLMLLLTIFIDKSFSQPVSAHMDIITDNYSTTNKLSLNNSDSQTLPPFIFPNDSSKFTFKQPNQDEINRLLRFTKINNSSTATPPELKKVLISHQGAKLFRVENLHDAPEIFPSDSPKDQVEDVQADDTAESDVGLEEQFRNPKLALQTQQNEIFDENIEVLPRTLNHGHIIAIISGILAAFCVAIYVGMVSWRSYLQKRYGMRQRLVTHDDYYSNDERTFNL